MEGFSYTITPLHNVNTTFPNGRPTYNCPLVAFKLTSTTRHYTDSASGSGTTSRYWVFFRWLCRCARRYLRLEGKEKVGIVTKRFEGRWFSNKGIPKPKLPVTIHFGLCELCQTYISKTQRNRLPLLFFFSSFHWFR